MTPGRPTVFLGPSLPVARARRVLDADYRPPLRRGDLDGLDALDTGAPVLIVDGLLDPGHRLPAGEARRALDRGLALYGAASTGALLAACLGDAGMTGIGRVHALFRAGRIGVDDIAVLQNPEDGSGLTCPLVNIIAWLDDMAAAGELAPDAASAAVAALRAMPIDHRTRTGIVAVLRRHLPARCGPSDVGAGLNPPLHAPCRRESAALRVAPWRDLKAEDALALLSLFRRSGRPATAWRAA